MRSLFFILMTYIQFISSLNETYFIIMIKCIKTIINLSANITTVLGFLLLVFGFYLLFQQYGVSYGGKYQFYIDLYYNSADWLKTLQ